jgi:hypothetical protein
MIPNIVSRHKILIIGLLIVAFVILPLVYFIYTSVERSGKTQVTLVALPDGAKITFNGKAVTPGTMFLQPGTYTLKAEKTGFASYEAIETIDQTNKIIAISLEPRSEEANKYVEDNQRRYLELEAKAGQASAEEGEKFHQKNPVTNSLPYTNYLYRIGYQKDRSDPTDTSIIVTIDAEAGYRNGAINQIRKLGYDPAQLKIMFRNYESPFENE